MYVDISNTFFQDKKERKQPLNLYTKQNYKSENFVHVCSATILLRHLQNYQDKTRRTSWVLKQFM